MAKEHVAVGAQAVNPGIVRVGGRYRVGKLLGAGTFGVSILKAIRAVIPTSSV